VSEYFTLRYLCTSIAMSEVTTKRMSRPTRDRQHAGAPNIIDIMDDAALVAPISDAPGESCRQSHPSLGLRQQQHPTVKGQPPAVKRCGRLPTANRWKRKPQRAIIDHGRRGTFCPDEKNGVDTHSLHQIKELSYDRQPQTDRPVNNPG
jgi:hypothetical protein